MFTERTNSARRGWLATIRLDSTASRGEQRSRSEWRSGSGSGVFRSGAKKRRGLLVSLSHQDLCDVILRLADCISLAVSIAALRMAVEMKQHEVCKKTYLYFSVLSLCLSRACLGKMIIFGIKMASQKTCFLPASSSISSSLSCARGAEQQPVDSFIGEQSRSLKCRFCWLPVRSPQRRAGPTKGRAEHNCLFSTRRRERTSLTATPPVSATRSETPPVPCPSSLRRCHRSNTPTCAVAVAAMMMMTMVMMMMTMMIVKESCRGLLLQTGRHTFRCHPCP